VVFGNFTGSAGADAAADGSATSAGADDGSANLIYDPDTGNVMLDASGAPGGIIINFVLESHGQFLPGADFPYQGVFTTESPNEVSQSDPLTSGWPADANPWNLGAILPPGLTRPELLDLLTRRTYVGQLGSGVREFEVVIPEPGTMVLLGIGMVGLGLSLRRRRRAA
jgi:hypothetical protein